MAKANDIAIDMSTSQTLIYMKGKGLILREPNIAAVDRESHNIFSYGEETNRSVGRLPSNLLIVRPLKDGVITDFEMVAFLLQSFVRKATGRLFIHHPRAVLSLPSGVNEMERRALTSSLLDTGLRRTQTMNRSIAAALGAGIRPDEPYATLIVDISAGVTDIAVVSSGHVIVSDCVNLGGMRFDDAIIHYLRKKYNLLIGEKTAEELKINIGSAIPRSEAQYMDITGRNLLSGLPKTLRITSEDVTEAIDEPLQNLIESIHSVLEHTPAEMAHDILEYGILLSGGGAEMFGLCEAIADMLGVPCSVAEDPSLNVVMGCGKVVENFNELGMYLDGARRRNY